MNRFTKMLAVAVPFGMALAPSVAFADTPSPVTTFTAQYQQNEAQEAQLSQNTQSLSVSNDDTLALRNRVQVLNQRISELYALEQKLAQTVANLPTPSTAKETGDDEGKAIAQRNHLLAQLKALWKTSFGVDAKFNTNGKAGAESSQSLPTLTWNGKHHQNVTIYLQNLLGLSNQDLSKWLASMASTATSGSSKEGDQWHGHGHGRGHSKHGGSVNIQATVQQLSNILQQLSQLESANTGVTTIPSKDSQGDDEHQANGLNKQLEETQVQILRLQSEVIADLQKWIQLATGSTGSSSGTVAGVTVSASASTTLEGGHLTYTAQLVNSANQPLKIAGVKIDFSIAGGNNDGSLAASSAVTDGNGQVTIDAVAGGVVGSLQVAAQVDGTTLPVASGPVVQVSDGSTSAVKLVAAGGAFPIALTLGQTTGTSTVLYPENSQGTVVAGDTLQITTSNPAVVALPSSSNSETLLVGQYTLPALGVKGIGSAVVTITDLTASTHPSVSYTVNVTAGDPVAIEAINPNGSMNSSYAVSAGTDGPFQIAVVNAAGAEVPAPSNIVLTAPQVNQIIGAGMGVRPANASNDVASVMILAGQSAVTVYADNVSAGNTQPTALNLASVVPSLVSADVRDNRTVVLTFNVGLKPVLPTLGDFWLDWGTGSGTPESVAVSGNTVTLTTWGTPIAHGSSVKVSYNPLSTDPNPLTSVYGQRAAVISSSAVGNLL